MSSPASLLQKSGSGEVDLTASPRKRGRELRFKWLLITATVISMAVLAWLLIDILTDGAGRVNSTLFTQYTSRFPEKTGVRSGLTGTLSLMTLTALIAFPLGLAAALYLEEFAGDNWFTRLVEANINNLASVPSVVYGLLGFGIFVGLLGFERSLLIGALTLSLLILPVIIVASRESLRAVPQEMRNGGLALGATPLQVAFTITLPAAFAGVMTGTILALSRAIGETAPILVAGAVFSRRADNVPWEFTEKYSALPIQIFDFVKRPQPEFQIEVAAAGIIVLMAVLLTMNSIAIYLRNKYSKGY
ncbi:phosphate ABC transporter permease PstA [soil metagenome]